MAKTKKQPHLFVFLYKHFYRPFDGCVFMQNLLDLPPEPALYCAVNKDRVLYVGIASNLQNRWKNHHKKEEINREYPDNTIIYYYLYENSVHLIELERRILDEYYMELNCTGKQYHMMVNKIDKGIEEFEKDKEKAREMLKKESERIDNLRVIKPITVEACSVTNDLEIQKAKYPEYYKIPQRKREFYEEMAEEMAYPKKIMREHPAIFKEALKEFTQYMAPHIQRMCL